MADSALVQRIVKEVRKLKREQQAEVLEYIRHIHPSDEFSFEEWLKEVEEFQEELRRKYGDDYFFNVQQTLDEIREEASWPRGL